MERMNRDRLDRPLDGSENLYESLDGFFQDAKRQKTNQDVVIGSTFIQVFMVMFNVLNLNQISYQSTFFLACPIVCKDLYYFLTPCFPMYKQINNYLRLRTEFHATCTYLANGCIRFNIYFVFNWRLNAHGSHFGSIFSVKKLRPHYSSVATLPRRYLYSLNRSVDLN